MANKYLETIAMQELNVFMHGYKMKKQNTM